MIVPGEKAQRLAENPKRLSGGPADLLNTVAFIPIKQVAKVWVKDDITVSAIRSTDVPDHATYRVDTPAGSVVIGGDSGNDQLKPSRASSTSAQVDQLSDGADVLVHSVIHPAMGPDGTSGFPPPIYFRQSTVMDLGSLSQRAWVGHLMLSEADYTGAVQAGGFKGEVTVGTDLATLRIVQV